MLFMDAEVGEIAHWWKFWVHSLFIETLIGTFLRKGTMTRHVRLSEKLSTLKCRAVTLATLLQNQYMSSCTLQAASYRSSILQRDFRIHWRTRSSFGRSSMQGFRTGRGVEWPKKRKKPSCKHKYTKACPTAFTFTIAIWAKVGAEGWNLFWAIRCHTWKEAGYKNLIVIWYNNMQPWDADRRTSQVFRNIKSLSRSIVVFGIKNTVFAK